MIARHYSEIIDELADLYDRGHAVDITDGLRIMGYVHQVCLSWDENDVNNVKDWCLKNNIDAILQRIHISFKTVEDAIAFKIYWGELTRKCAKHKAK